MSSQSRLLVDLLIRLEKYNKKIHVEEMLLGETKSNFHCVLENLLREGWIVNDFFIIEHVCTTPKVNPIDKSQRHILNSFMTEAVIL